MDPIPQIIFPCFPSLSWNKLPFPAIPLIPQQIDGQGNAVGLTGIGQRANLVRVDAIRKARFADKQVEPLAEGRIPVSTAP